MSVRIIHTADLHLGVQPSDFKVDRLQDFIKSLNKIKEYAIKNNSDIVIIAGDVFHHPRPTNKVMYEFSVFVRDLIANGIHVVIIRGNHDASQIPEQRTFLDALDTILGGETSTKKFFHYLPRISSITVKGKSGKNIKIIGVPYVRPRVTGERSTDVEKLKNHVEERLKSELDARSDSDYTVVAAHLSLEGFTYGAERRLAFLENEVRFPVNMFVRNGLVSYVAMGHIHKHQDRKVGDVSIVYSGSIERVDFGEHDEKKYFIDIKEENGRLQWKPVELDIRPMHVIHIDTRGHSLDYINDELRKKRDIRDSLIKLILKVGEREKEIMKPEVILKYLDTFNVYDAKLEYEMLNENVSIIEMSKASSLEEMFKEYVKNAVDPSIRDVVIERGLRLLRELEYIG
ncbi:MAG: metallophosphoesterase family protein [Thermoprotei archaeon]